MAQTTGVWLVGGLGSLSTTVITGCRAIVRGHASEQGLLTANDDFGHLGLVPLDALVFGGHDIRSGNLRDSALEIAQQNGSLDRGTIEELRDDLERATAEIRPGTALSGGQALSRLSEGDEVKDGGPLVDVISTIQRDIQDFQTRHSLDRVIVVNVASTEPPLAIEEGHQSLKGLDHILDQSAVKSVRPSLLYAYAAIDAGFPFINFTPSNGALIPAMEELALKRCVPFMGSDGKTGETLVKTALAPMFKHRALKVLSWQGYNMLGNRDGEVLSDAENLAAKVQSKDQALPSILGYPIHTHVGIDYVPSLNDMKTAWDFIHFEGFMGMRMSMQFIWQGCDSILAAPLVIDLVRMVELAARRGESGPLPHLACFFKSPHGIEEHDLHQQMELLFNYVGSAGQAG